MWRIRQALPTTMKEIQWNLTNIKIVYKQTAGIFEPSLLRILWEYLAPLVDQTAGTKSKQDQNLKHVLRETGITLPFLCRFGKIQI